MSDRFKKGNIISIYYCIALIFKTYAYLENQQSKSYVSTLVRTTTTANGGKYSTH